MYQDIRCQTSPGLLYNSGLIVAGGAIAAASVCAMGVLLRRMFSPRAPLPKHGSAVLVTGAASGIGAATAVSLSNRGFIVFCGVRRLGSMNTVEGLCSVNVVEVKMDICSQASVEDAFIFIGEECRARGVQLHGVVNCAGVALNAPVEVLPLSILRDNLETNLVGALCVTQHAMPMLRLSKGRVVNVSSLHGFIATPFSGAYCASKFALEALSDCLRREVRPWDVTVAVVQPGYVRTAIQEKNVQTWRNIFDSITHEEKQRYSQYYSDEAIQRRYERSCNIAISASEAATAIIHALVSPRPRVRYRVGRQSLVSRLGADFLPEHFVDAYMAKSMWPGPYAI